MAVMFAMRRNYIAVVMATLFASGLPLDRLHSEATSANSARGVLAATPPMGWNSWDSYGTTVTETDVRAAADFIAEHLKPYGWQYVVVDMEWFVTNPTLVGNSRTSQLTLDEYGRYTPALNRFPSAAHGAGFKPLADYVHAHGLKFGLHVLRGIPKRAVTTNLPIADSHFHAADAADSSDTCPWNPDNFGIANNAAGQAYYDSIARLYAQWGADFVKVDCIASRPYKADEIQMLSTGLRRTGRPIVLSLSPGPAPSEKVDEMRHYAEMWRISDDVWDMWHSSAQYPQGVGDQFPRAAQWVQLARLGSWPDADMLPVGYLGPAPGWGQARTTRLTHEEQRTLITLWCIFRSPLMWGGNPSQTDEWTLSLLTNPEVLAVDQHSLSLSSRVVLQNDAVSAWLAQPADGKGDYLAVFNLKDAHQNVDFAWKELSLPSGKYELRDLWQRKDLGGGVSLSVDLPPHGSILYRIKRHSTND